MTNYRINSIIIGTGSYIPTIPIENNFFLENKFYEPSGIKIENSGTDIIEKFQKITGIKERRYLNHCRLNSDMAFYSAVDALSSVKKKNLMKNTSTGL